MAETIMYEDAADLIHAAGLAVKGTTLFGNRTPALPDNVVMVFEHTGFEPERAMAGRRIDVLTLQVLVRNLSVTAGRATAYAIYDLLDKTFNLLTPVQRILNGVQYYSMLAKHAPFSIGQDENKRYRWTCNYVVMRD